MIGFKKKYQYFCLLVLRIKKNEKKMYIGEKCFLSVYRMYSVFVFFFFFFFFLNENYIKVTHKTKTKKNQYTKKKKNTDSKNKPTVALFRKSVSDMSATCQYRPRSTILHGGLVREDY